ncbi:MAG: corrinoid protein [Candidatus Bathyarchaeia archaeon]
MEVQDREVLDKLSKSMVDLDMESVKEEVKKALERRIPPQIIIKEGLGKGMEEVGEKFASHEYFLSDLIVAGVIMQEAMKILEPYLEAGVMVPTGKVVIATVEGDLHDIGKNIVVSMLKSAGFTVVDLGVDVPAEKIIKKSEEVNADIVALSALLSVVVPFLEKTVKAVKESPIGSRVKVLVGGRCVDEDLAKRIGADAYAHDAWEGVAKAKELMASLAKT